MKAKRATVNQLVPRRAHTPSVSESCQVRNRTWKGTSETPFQVKTRVLVSRIIVKVKNSNTKSVVWGRLSVLICFEEKGFNFWASAVCGRYTFPCAISDERLYGGHKPLVTGREATEGASFPSGHSGYRYSSQSRLWPGALTVLAEGFIRSIRALSHAIASKRDVNAAAIVTDKLVARANPDTGCWETVPKLPKETSKQ